MTDPGDPSQNTAPQDWTYQAQGGANIVFAYDGIPPQRQFVGKLLRVRKVNAHRSSTELSGEEEEELEVGFGKEVVGPLLGEDSVVPVHSYSVQEDWLNQLKEMLSWNSAAAADRTAPAEVDTAASRVQLTDNLTHGHNTLAIEIKPKWGFLPPPPPPPTSSPSIPTACRFCKHSTLRQAHLPMTDKHVAHQANYCPLDLYSGEPIRAYQAVRALATAWQDSRGKQNNLRIFWNGRRVDPGDASTLEQIELALKPAHVHNHPDFNTNTQRLEPHIRVALLALLGSPILARLRHLQSSFAPITVSQLLPRLPNPLPPQPNLATWRVFVGKYTDTPLTVDAPVEDLLLGHSLSATFKDCSVFLRSTQDPQTGAWQTEIKAIDLDPKPLGKVHKWAELEREVDENWERESRAWREAGWEVRECYE